jgi:hypothetical protein
MLGRHLVPRIDQIFVKEDNVYIPLHKWITNFVLVNSDKIDVLAQLTAQANEILSQQTFIHALKDAWTKPTIPPTIHDIKGYKGNLATHIILLAFLAPNQIYPQTWLTGVIRVNKLHRSIKWKCQYHFV